MTDKRIIRAAPGQASGHARPMLPPGWERVFGALVGYDDMYDYITDDSESHAGALYASVKIPVFDGEGNKISDETILHPAHPSIVKRHTFADWTPVGQDP